MLFVQTPLAGAYVIEPESIPDERGFFARTFCRNQFTAQGLNPNLAQCNISFNKLRGTLRGMHYQKAPYQEAKLVRCTQGAIYDVVIDLRRDSTTFTKWFGIELNADNRKAIYIPEGFAHGFLSLRDNTEVFYQMSEIYQAEYATGVRWDDPMILIKWPNEVNVISERDLAYLDFIAQ
jgi:dTDP-4-dehydrorhamnose 3,5-epimerase